MKKFVNLSNFSEVALSQVNASRILGGWCYTNTSTTGSTGTSQNADSSSSNDVVSDAGTCY
jgi:hypothetical protein